MSGLRLRHGSLAAICLVCLLLAGGCGRPTMAKVSGTVTSQGKPVADAIVQFLPANRPGAGCRTDASGKYALTTFKPGDGAYLGPCKVVVMPFVPGIDPDKPAPPPKPRPDIPDKYRDSSTTPLSAEVKRGVKNTFDFELSSERGFSK